MIKSKPNSHIIWKALLLSNSTIHKKPNCTNIQHWHARWLHEPSLDEEELILVSYGVLQGRKMQPTYSACWKNGYPGLQRQRAYHGSLRYLQVNNLVCAHTPWLSNLCGLILKLLEFHLVLYRWQLWNKDVTHSGLPMRNTSFPAGQWVIVDVFELPQQTQPGIPETKSLP